jgi:hypothetical protein
MVHREEQNPPFCGTSKAARRRRAERYWKCPKCGKWLHYGHCTRNQTKAQFEYIELIRLGAIRYLKEQSARMDSNVYERIRQDLDFIINKAELDPLTLIEMIDEKEKKKKARKGVASTSG